jgi:hypothetical protein
MVNIFEKKKISDFSNDLKDVFNFLRISRTIKVVGSASYKNAKYVADYDLNEIFNRAKDSKSILDSIYLFFVEKFKQAEKDEDVFISDFKCGTDSDGDPLRWDKKDIKNGYKSLKDGRQISFQDCLLMKATMKLDVIVLIDGIFTEFSDNYLIKLGDKANFFPYDLNPENNLNSIAHDFDEYFYASHNYFKGLKRCFSYYSAEDPKKNKQKMIKLFNFFNSKTGLLYKQMTEIGTILLLLEQKFRKPDVADIRNNIKLISEKTRFVKYPFLEESLEKAIKAKNFKSIYKFLDDASKGLLKVINTETLQFLKGNKSVLLY